MTAPHPHPREGSYEDALGVATGELMATCRASLTDLDRLESFLAELVVGTTTLRAMLVDAIGEVDVHLAAIHEAIRLVERVSAVPVVVQRRPRPDAAEGDPFRAFPSGLPG